MDAVAASEGVLTLEEPAGKIGPGMNLRQFSEGLGKTWKTKAGETWTSFELRGCRIGGQKFIVTVRFDKERMDCIELYVERADDGSNWADWSEEKERRRKEAGEKWIAGYFGRETVVKPFAMEDGTDVTPFEVNWDSARHVKFNWGEVISFYDSKGGFSGVAVRYAN